jgi:molybdate transport system substrate-binding protein
MRIGSLAVAAKCGFMILLAYGLAAEAAEIKVLSAAALRPALNELGPRFERETGHKLVIQYEVVGVLKRQIEGGERFDVAILTTPFMEDLAKQGKIAADTRANIARSGIGVFVRAGAPKPSIKSADAFKRAMLNAKSVGYSREGATAMYLATLFERLGIAEQMKAKTKYVQAGRAAQSVADGEAELGLVVISAIEPVPGVELLGPLPAELQHYVGYTGGVGAAAKEAKVCKAFIEFLRAPAAVPVLKAKGMEPITP